MAEWVIRQACLDDTQGIGALFQARIPTWQRLNDQGRVEDLPYAVLSIYERWLHGSQNDSAWMSVETGAIHLSHLLCGTGLPLVAVAPDDTVLAYAEAYHSREPKPFGDHLHLAHLIVPGDGELAAEMMRFLVGYVQKMMDCTRLTVSVAEYDAETAAFYQQLGMKFLARSRRFMLPAKTGQSFYQAVDHARADAAQIAGWTMTVGRVESSRQHWEMIWPRLWEAIPQIASRRTHRLRFTASGQEAFIACQQGLYSPRSAEIWCWSPKPLTTQLLTAIRDWAHREGYRDLILVVSEDAIKTLGTEAEAQPYDRSIYALDVGT